MTNLKSVLTKSDVHHPLFEATPRLLMSVSSSLRKKSFGRDERVVSHGDEAAHFWLVYEGWVKLTRQTPDGKETIIGLCTAGDVFGEAALFAGASYPYTAEIVGERAELASILASTLRTVIAQDTTISANIMGMLNERVSQAQLKLEHMSTMSAAQRLGCFLLRLCHTQAEGAKTLHIPIEKNVLATYLGMKPETLSRSQQQLKPLGIHVSGAQIEVSNIERLQKFVCGSCSESGSCEAGEAAS